MVITQGCDYQSLDERMERIAEINRVNNEARELVIACGCARYDNDRSVEAVFEKADRNMYENKKALKTL